MNKTITVKKDGTVLLSSFVDLLDINTVKFYSFKVNRDKSVTIKFYDGKKKLVRPYGQK